MNTQEEKREIDNISGNPMSHVTPVTLPAWALGVVPKSIPVAPPVISTIPIALPSPVPVAGDDWPAWEQAEPPGEPCPACNSLEYWVSVLGVRHCQICHPPKLHKARVLARKAARLRRKGAPC